MGKRVLVVDDSPFMRMLVKNVLVPNGYEIVAEASDGAQAIQAYKEKKPDLVTMDLVMPGVDGIKALQGIRETDPAARVVMVTSAGQASMMMEAMRLGSAGYITKPFQADKMLETVKRALGEIA